MRRNVIIIKRSESALEALLDNANADKAALQAEIDGLDGQITTLNADKAALQAEIDGLDGQITTLNADKAALTRPRCKRKLMALTGKLRP